MRVQLRGLSGDTSLNGQCGKVGGFEGERVFVRLDNSNRVVSVQVLRLPREGPRRRLHALLPSRGLLGLLQAHVRVPHLPQEHRPEAPRLQLDT